MSHKTYVIAEIGSNHMGDFATAIRLIEAAKRAGADGVKFQLFTPHGLAHPTHPAQETLRRFTMPREWISILVQVGKHMGIDVSATPCDLEAVDLLDILDVPWIKIASGDLTYHKLIRHAAKTGRRLILSTGFATEEDIDLAVNTIESSSPPIPELVLLQCVGAYPSDVEDANLRVINRLALNYGCVCGLSDHTTDIFLPALAVAAGAKVIEKHIRLHDTPLDSPDQPHSLDPIDFTAMVDLIRMTEAAMGNREKRVLPGEADLRITARRGLYWASDLPAGYVVQESDIAVVRPGFSFDRNEAILSTLQPSDEERLLGRTLLCSVRQWEACGLGQVMK